MKTLLNILMATIMLVSLNACVVAPAYPGYVEPGATIMVPSPYYGPAYYGPGYYGFGFEYRGGGRGWHH